MFIDPGYLILLSIIVLLLFGVPIAYVLGITAALMIFLDPAVMPMVIGLIPFGGANNYLLVAALLFMIAGEVMNQGRIAEKLIAFASSLVGHIRGGLAHVNIFNFAFLLGNFGHSDLGCCSNRISHDSANEKARLFSRLCRSRDIHVCNHGDYCSTLTQSHFVRLCGQCLHR